MIPHANRSTEVRFLIAIGLTAAIFIAELAGGIWTRSLALLSDSAHVFMDVFALGMSYVALRLSALPADDRHTFGYHRLEVLAAAFNGATLILVSGGIFIEAFRRLQDPEPIRTTGMLIIAAVGLVVNLAAASALGLNTQDHNQHQHRDLNIHSAFLHVLGDALSSVGVIIAAILISVTGWIWIDPVVSILIGLMILIGAYRVLRSSLHILIEGVPEGISLTGVDQSIRAVPGVADLHDLHVWNICSGHVALSAHVVLCGQEQTSPSRTMAELKNRLSSGFGIEHTTVQFETASCAESPSACRCK